MRLSEGIIADTEKTLGQLRFSALRREVKELDENGEETGAIKKRTYDLKSRGQGQMIQVSLPAAVERKDFVYNAEVELVNAVFGTASSADYREVKVNWYINADDLVLKNPIKTEHAALIPEHDGQDVALNQDHKQNKHQGKSK